MGLPVPQVSIGTLSDGTEIRGLTRSEALAVRNAAGDEARQEVLVIMAAASVTERVAEQWHTAASSPQVEELVNKAAELSGLDPRSAES